MILISPWKDIFRKRAVDWAFGVLQANQVPDGLQPETIEADKSYLNIFLRSMRVVDVRRGLKKFYGTVHSFISFPHIYNQKAEFHVLTTPKQLKDINAKKIDRIIQLNHRLLGPVPYRGGDVRIELGLFSIKSVDLADSFLQVLEGMTTAAGVSFIKQAMPFAGPLTEGVNLLLGAKDDTILEIGLSTTFIEPKTGYFVVMRAPKSEIDLTSIRVDKDYRLIDKTGNPITDYPYMVFCIETSTEREAWFEIPEIATAHKNVKDAVRAGNVNVAQEAFTIFKRTTLTSPDLLINDAHKLVQEVGTELEHTLQAFKTASGGAMDIRSLNQIDLYG